VATPPYLRIGLTGGIASGKSAVASEFAALGVPVVDADVIARELVEPGQPALQRLIDLFGADILDSGGRLDRRRMRDRVFADPSQRKQLESVLHPAVRAALRSRSAQCTHAYQILVIPLLVESGLEDLVDRVLVVDASPATQSDRLRKRDTIGEEQARSMMAAQASRELRLAAADDVISNSGSLEDLKDKVHELHRRYLALANASR